MIAALFVETNGVYFGLPDVDPWDEKRDARKYAGPWPIVAHPPCNRWSIVAQCRNLRNGQDNGCFESALNSVERYGGVLEHPAFSLAWERFGIAPTAGPWQKTIRGGWTCQVAQNNYGHKATKLTWLYAYNVDIPSLNWEISKSQYVVASSKRGQKEIPKHLRSRSPEPFRDLLLSIARSCVK